MGDDNQLCFVRNNLSIAKAPILEVGSKDYGNTPNYRLLFSGSEYIGTDMENGKGVEVVLDFTADIRHINETLGNKQFGTVICMSVLEHCKNPFKVASNISQLLNRGGGIVLRRALLLADSWLPIGLLEVYARRNQSSFSRS